MLRLLALYSERHRLTMGPPISSFAEYYLERWTRHRFQGWLERIVGFQVPTLGLFRRPLQTLAGFGYGLGSPRSRCALVK
jgi:hypothetical protein